MLDFSYFIRISPQDAHKDDNNFVMHFFDHFLVYLVNWVYFNIATHDDRFRRNSDHYTFYNRTNCIVVIVIHSFVTRRRSDLTSWRCVARVVRLVFRKVDDACWLVDNCRYKKFLLQVTDVCCFVILLRLIAYKVVVVHLREFSFIGSYSYFCPSNYIDVF